jgi:hypothetical protein
MSVQAANDHLYTSALLDRVLTQPGQRRPENQVHDKKQLSGFVFAKSVSENKGTAIIGIKNKGGRRTGSPHVSLAVLTSADV